MKTSLLKSFWHLFKGYWSSEEKLKARLLLGVVIALNVALVYMNVWLSEWNRDFFNALQNYEESSFLPMLKQFTIIALIYITIAVYAIYLRQMLEIRWRTWLTNKYLSSWLNKQIYYRLNLIGATTDNPDQRISEDINRFVSISLQLCIGLIRQLLTLAAFGFVLWELSGVLNFTLGGMEITIPGYMFWFCLIYAGLGTFFAHKIGYKLIGLNFDQQKYEADFRFSMMRVRENSESIAFYRGEEAELKGFKDKFAFVIKNYWQLMKKTKHLNFYSNTYAQLAVVVPYIMAAPRYFSGEIKMGGLTQISIAFSRVQDALSFFIDAYSTIAEFASVIKRLSGFTQHIEEAEEITSEVKRVNSSDKDLTLENLTVKLPNNKVLIRDLNIKLEKSKRLIVTGSSGTGKSTLLRTLAGIWIYATGVIKLPENAKILFLPQRPYLPLGTLKRALMYPLTESPSDDKLKEILKLVDLPELTSKLDTEDDWSRILSLGEQQRLAFARVLLTEPEYLFLDEATSALDEPREQEMYELIRNKIPEITIVSVGHRSTLFKQHDIELSLTAGGSYNVRKL